jgi:hypothetical protein
MDWCWIAKPSVVHFLNICRAGSIQERFGSGWVVWFNSRSGDKVICNLKSRSKRLLISCHLILFTRACIQSKLRQFSSYSHTHFRFLLTHQPWAKILLSWWVQEVESGSSTMHFSLSVVVTELKLKDKFISWM